MQYDELVESIVESLLQESPVWTHKATGRTSGNTFVGSSGTTLHDEHTEYINNSRNYAASTKRNDYLMALDKAADAKLEPTLSPELIRALNYHLYTPAGRLALKRGQKRAR